MLQSLLQPRENPNAKMIGAMPAVAVRHERRRAEKRGGGRRPSQLPLSLGRPGDVDNTPSPDRHRFTTELYVCGKTAGLHAVVGAVLLGIVILVVGVVQLSPGAEAAQHRYYLLGSGAALLGAGTVGGIIRMACIHWYKSKFRDPVDVEQPTPKASDHHHGHDQPKGSNDHSKPRLKSQASVGRDVDVLVKQPSAASDT